MLPIRVKFPYIQVHAVKQRVRSIITSTKIKLQIISQKELNIIIGSGNTSQEKWISTDKNTLNLLNENTWIKLLGKRKATRLLAEHVWEHLSIEEGKLAAEICYKFLGQGGRIRIAVPDGNFPSQEYINNVKPNGSGAGADDHKVLYTYETLSKIFEVSGFKVELLEYYDENKSFHHKPWNLNDGKIQRSLHYDSRNKNNEIRYTSIILDAFKI